MLIFGLISQGRIVISDDMKDFAGIESKTVLVGDWDKIQIWSHYGYRDFKRRNQDNPNKYGEAIGRAVNMARRPGENMFGFPEHPGADFNGGHNAT